MTPVEKLRHLLESKGIYEEAVELMKAHKRLKEALQPLKRDISYRAGYRHGFNNAEFKCPSAGNAHAEYEYTWGYSHGKNDREMGKAPAYPVTAR